VKLAATNSVHLIELVMVGSVVGIQVLLLAAVFARNLTFYVLSTDIADNSLCLR